MKEVFDFIKRTKVFHFATVDQEGRPHVRPFSGCILLDDQIHFFTTNYKKVYEQIQHNPWIELSSHDPMSHEWMRLSGRVVCDDDPRVWEAMAAARRARVAAGKAKQESVVPPESKVYFHLEQTRAEFHGTGRETRVVEF